MSTKEYDKYYVPASSPWPFVGALGLFVTAIGASIFINQLDDGVDGNGGLVLTAGAIILLVMVFGWFKDQIDESMTGLHSIQLGNSYRQGMVWFIFSEIMFFMAFFGALFYARTLSIPWLGGEGAKASTNLLWEGFTAHWPLIKTPGGEETQAMPWTGLPLINTIILLVSSFTVHIAHVAIEKNDRTRAKLFMFITVALGVIFLFLQVEEYIHAYTEMNLRLDSGIYGSTFFMLTGFHGMHVTLGTVILFVLLLRILKGHFTPDNHFAFVAGSWYWHFVDVVWLCLFVFVYVL